MNRIPSPLRRIGKGTIKLAKSLTFWSIIIGLLLAVETALVIDVYGIFKEKGIFYALNTNDFKITLIIGVIIVFLLMLFYYIERDQNTKSQKDMDKMVNAINANTKELKKISLAIQQSLNQNSSPNAKNKPNNQAKNKSVVIKKLDDGTNKPQNESEQNNATNK